MTKIVRKKLSSSSITEARKGRLAKLAARPDSTIDFSDIPELTEKFWRNAVRNPYRPIKKQLRLDGDVNAWLRKQAKANKTARTRSSAPPCCATSSKKPAKSETLATRLP